MLPSWSPVENTLRRMYFIFLCTLRVQMPAALPSSRRSPQPRDRTQVFHTAGGFYLPSKPPGNPKNPEVECHFLLQGILPTKTSNQHLLCLLNWQAGSLPPAPPGKHLVHKVYLCINFFCLFVCFCFLFFVFLASPFTT